MSYEEDLPDLNEFDDEPGAGTSAEATEAVPRGVSAQTHPSWARESERSSTPADASHKWIEPFQWPDQSVSAGMPLAGSGECARAWTGETSRCGVEMGKLRRGSSSA